MRFAWSASSLEVFVETYPTVVVGIVTVLDSSQTLIEGGADRTRVAVLADDVAFVFVEVIYAQDRADDSSRTAGTCFVEGSESSTWTGRHSTVRPMSSASCMRLLFVIEGRIEGLLGVM